MSRVEVEGYKPEQVAPALAAKIQTLPQVLRHAGTATNRSAGRRSHWNGQPITFLGYEFRPRLAKSKTGKHFVSFLPAVSTDAVKAMGREIRSSGCVRPGPATTRPPSGTT